VDVDESVDLPRSRSRGAGIFTIRIYRAVLDAGDAGVTVEQVHQRLREIPGFRSDTRTWAYRHGVDDLHEAGLARVRQRIDAMRRQGIIVSLGKSRLGSRYVVGRPPKGYRPKYVRQKRHGYYDIDPAVGEAATRRHIDTVNWIAATRQQLALDKPRTARMRELLEEAMRLLEH